MAIQFRSEKRISHKILTPIAHMSIRSATEFFFLEKTPKANFALFSVKFFKFELVTISNIWRGIYDSAFGIDEENPIFRFIEYENPNISLDISSSNVAISILIWKTYFSQYFHPVCLHVDSVWDRIFFSRDKTKSQPLCTFFVEIF